MNILENIVADKKQEVDLKKSVVSVKQLEASDLFKRATISLSIALKSGNGIIAEHKRRSPSKGTISDNFSVQDITKGYENAGV